MTKNQYKKKTILMVLSVIAFLGLVLSASWAVMTISASHGNVNLTASISSRPVFSATATDEISLEVGAIGQEVQEEYVAASDTATIDILLSSNWTNNVTCNYDIVWEWTETLDDNAKYIKTAGASKEYTVSGVSNNDSFEDVQLDNYNLENRKQVLYNASITVGANQMVSDTWTFTNSFYKTKVSQNGHKGHSYSGKIYVENVLCGVAS